MRRARRLWVGLLALGLAVPLGACGSNNHYGSFPHPGENSRAPATTIAPPTHLGHS